MTPSNAEKKLNLEPALDKAEVTIESGVWVSLDLDNPAWSWYGKFTLRASWPAYVSVKICPHLVGKITEFSVMNHEPPFSIPVIYS